MAGWTFGIDADDFPGLQIAGPARAKGVKGTGFRGEQDRLPHPAHDQRAHAVGVADRVDRFLGHQQQRKRTRDPAQRFLQRVDKGRRRRPGDQVQDDFRIDPGGKNLPLLEQLGAQGFSIGERTIVGQRHRTEAGIQRQWLDVLQPRPAHGGIADVADRAVAVEVEAARVGGEVV